MPRILRATFSQEAADDLRNWHNIDAESALTQIIAEEVQADIDRSIISDLDAINAYDETFDVDEIIASLDWPILDSIPTPYEYTLRPTQHEHTFRHRYFVPDKVNWQKEGF